MPALSHKVFEEKANNLYAHNSTAQETIFEWAVEIGKANCESKDSPTDITMSYDMSWLTQGYKSHIGIGGVIHYDTIETSMEKERQWNIYLR